MQGIKTFCKYNYITIRKSASTMGHAHQKLPQENKAKGNLKFQKTSEDFEASQQHMQSG